MPQLTQKVSPESTLKEKDPKWYVAYTFPKSEKAVQNKLEKIGIHSYLPLRQVVREWSDRKKKLLIPLFPNYIFVYASENERHESFIVKEILRYVSFDGKASIISNTVIDSLKHILSRTHDVHVEDLTNEGMPVKIIHGPFNGVEGVILRTKGRERLIVQIRALQRSVALNISTADVESMFLLENHHA